MKNLCLAKALIFTVTLTACEGFKIISIRNDSNGDARLIIRSDAENNISKKVQDNSVINLPQDSSVVLSSNFGPILFRGKIKPKDLQIKYLRIETKSDTIYAFGKEEILDLIYSSKYRTQTTGSKNLRTFIIKQ